jgi:hypothetical protein
MSVLPIESTRTVAHTAHPAPVLITEHEVLLGSAATVALPAAPAQGWLATVRRIFATTSEDRQRPKRHSYPPRSSYLEDSRMSREMRRL